MTRPFDLTAVIEQHWLANHPVLLLVTEEPYRVTAAAQAAAERLGGLSDRPVCAWGHDKVCGFHQGVPGIRPPEDRRSNALTVALPMMLEPLHVMRQASADNVPPFDPRQDILFLLRDVHWELTEGPSRPSVIQILRNAIQANMASPHYWLDEHDQPLRGKRMLVLVSPVGGLPADLPEIEPVHVPLPDDAMLERALADTLDPAAGRTNAAGEVNRTLDPAERQLLVRMGRGFTQPKWEEALALALVACGGYNDLEGFLGALSSAKSRMLAGIPGLQHIPHDRIPPEHLPGYEELEAFIADRMALSPAHLAEHRLRPLRGLTLVGPPGTGKTQFAMLVARLTGTDLLILSLGESQGSLVGQSEHNLRRALNVARRIGATVLIDDADKAGLAVAAHGHTGDGGVGGRMVQMLLTEMSRTELDGPVFLFTANRVQHIPGELLRAGRMDERFVVLRPDGPTRLHILRVHLGRHAMQVDDGPALERLAHQHTADWVGAELADLVQKASVRALAAGGQSVDVQWMIERADQTVPMVRLPAFAADLAEMERAASQFRPVGRIPGPARSEPRAARGRRSIRI